MLNVFDVADYFLSPANNEDSELITHLKLQKLLYYAQGYSLALLDEPLFPEEILKWEHGPVVVEIWNTYKKYLATPLPQSMFEVLKFSDKQLHLLERVRKEKGMYTAWALRDMTHNEAPWLNTGYDQIMQKDYLKVYFKSTIEKPVLTFDLERIKNSIESGFIELPKFDDIEEGLKYLEETT